MGLCFVCGRVGALDLGERSGICEAVQRFGRRGGLSLQVIPWIHPEVAMRWVLHC